MSERDNRIHFRTRGGPTQGWGNVYRLASFAEQCRQRGHGQPLFFAEGPETVASFLRNRGFDVVHLPDGIGIEEERRVLADHSHAEATFLEMLEATPELQRLHRESTNLLVVFDDLCDQVYEADLVVCGQGLPSHANQALSAEGTEFLVGYDYFLMRPEFLEKRDAARTIRPRLERVLVTLGGGRYDVGYLKAAHGLAGSGLELDTTFVLGHEADAELRAGIRELLPNARLLSHVDNLPDLLLDHDLVIAGAGYTKLEAALMGTPQVTMSVQWHQIPLASVFSACTGVPDLGYMSYAVPQAIADRVLELQSQESREELAAGASSVVDGKGFDRVSDAVFGWGTEEDLWTEAAA